MLTKKPLGALLLLASAAGGPYVLYETDAGQQAKVTAEKLLGFAASATSRDDSSASQGSWWQSASNPASADVAGEPDWAVGGWGETSAPGFGPGQLASFQTASSRSLRDVLRFDITPPMVTQQYSRVSTILADMNLDGMRVPLVTGTQVHDLAGTLSYYFDRFQRLQRISIHGVTGEPNRLIFDLRQLYQLEQHPSLGGGLYLIKWNGQPTSLLHIAPAAVIQANESYARYTVFLELNLPSMPYGLSSEAARFVEAGKATQRW